jgi:hypothetical protein
MPPGFVVFADHLFQRVEGRFGIDLSLVISLDDFLDPLADRAQVGLFALFRRYGAGQTLG